MTCCDIKLIFISMVVAFLLYSTAAERNVPTNKFSDISRSQRGIGWKIPAHVFRIKNPLSSRFVSSETSRRGSSETSSRHLRRSLDLGIPSNEIINSIASHSATYLEPMLLRKEGKPFFDKSLSAFDPLGPMIGPLNLPGFGKNLYLRLTVPPNEEEANHVTVHLTMKPGSIPFVENDNNGKLFGRKPSLGELVFTGERDEPNISFEKKPFDHFIAQEFVGEENMNWNPMHQVSFGFNASPPPPPPPPLEPEHRPAPNHHQLPIVHRTLENLIDLPIYPPLSPLKPGYGNHAGVRDSGNGIGVSNDGRTDVKIFPRIMQNSFSSSNYGNPLKGGMTLKNIGSGHVLTTGRDSGDAIIRNVVSPQNPKHSSNDDVSVTEGTRQTPRVNETPKLNNVKTGERVRATTTTNSDKN